MLIIPSEQDCVCVRQACCFCEHVCMLSTCFQESTADSHFSRHTLSILETQDCADSDGKMNESRKWCSVDKDDENISKNEMKQFTKLGLLITSDPDAEFLSTWFAPSVGKLICTERWNINGGWAGGENQLFSCGTEKENSSITQRERSTGVYFFL